MVFKSRRCDALDEEIDSAGLKNLEDLLKCRICFEFYSTAMVFPSCSHNYCSICIRKYLSYKTQCPSCGKNVTSQDLKPNRLIDEIVDKFIDLKYEMLECLEETNLKGGGSASSRSKSGTNQVNTISSQSAKKQVGQQSASKATSKGFIQSQSQSTPKAKKRIFKPEKDDDSDSDFFSEAKRFQPQKTTRSSRKKKATPKIEEKDEDTGEDEPADSNDVMIIKTKCGVGTPRHKKTPRDITKKSKTVSDVIGQRPSCRRPVRDEGFSSLDLPCASKQTDCSQDSGLISCTSAAGASINSSQASSSSSKRLVDIKVECPVCSVPIGQKFVNLHLDECLKRQSGNYSPRKSPDSKRKSMPKVVYKLMKDKELKRRLKEIGMSTIGTREILENRHREYTILFNAECDSLHPKSVSQMIRQVEKVERNKAKHEVATYQTQTQAIQSQYPAHASVFRFPKKTPAKDVVDKAKKEYAKEHKQHFKDLINDVRRRQKEAKLTVKNQSKPVVENETKQSEENNIIDRDGSESLAGPVTPDICDILSGEQSAVREYVINFEDSTRIVKQQKEPQKDRNTDIRDSFNTEEFVPVSGGLKTEAESDEDSLASSSLLSPQTQPFRESRVNSQQMAPQTATGTDPSVMTNNRLTLTTASKHNESGSSPLDGTISNSTSPTFSFKFDCSSPDIFKDDESSFKRLPVDMLDDTPERSSVDTLEDTPERSSVDTLEDTPERSSVDTLEDTPERLSVDTLEDTPDGPKDNDNEKDEGYKPSEESSLGTISESAVEESPLSEYLPRSASTRKRKIDEIKSDFECSDDSQSHSQPSSNRQLRQRHK